MRREASGIRCVALLGAIVLALTLAACGVPTPRTTAPSASSSPTPTVRPARPLAWQARKLPQDALVDALSPLARGPLTFTQRDARTAFVCAPVSSDGRLGAQMWVTHDGEATWQREAAITMAKSPDSCTVIADDADSQIQVVLTYRDSHSGCMGCFEGDYRNYVTADGGASWTPLSGPDELVTQLATANGATYTLFRQHPVDMSPLRSTLAVSRDHMRTWTPIDTEIKAADPGRYGRKVTAFWLNMTTGELLAQTGTAYEFSTQFWSTRDGGQHWTRWKTPVADSYVVRYPTGSAPWRVCGERGGTSGDHPSWPSLLTCTADGGATWQDRGGHRAPGVFAIAGDGSVLLAQSTEVLRLAPASDTWESLGTEPDAPRAGRLDYVASGGDGALWLQPANDGSPYTKASVYVATYPSADGG